MHGKEFSRMLDVQLHFGEKKSNESKEKLNCVYGQFLPSFKIVLGKCISTWLHPHDKTAPTDYLWSSDNAINDGQRCVR